MKHLKSIIKTLIITTVLSASSYNIANANQEVFNLSTATPTSGTNWHFNANISYFDNNPGAPHPPNGNTIVPTLFVNDGANLTITGISNNGKQAIRVVVSGTAKITLDNATITRTGDAIRISPDPAIAGQAVYVPVSPMMLDSGANLTLTLVGDNTLAMATGSGNRWSAGLGVPYGSSLTIEGNGSLTAVAGLNAAGIGSHEGTHLSPKLSGNITINSGTIIATGTNMSAGIGGGSLIQAGQITINGGNITATGGTSRNNQGNPNGGGAGIGGGNSANLASSDNVITINGGVINAIAGGGSAGIGSGASGLSGIVNISGGVITATGGDHILRGGAGIGGGESARAGNISITGGTITAVGGSGRDGTGAGIGRGIGTTTIGDNIVTINGDAVIFASLENTATLTRGIVFTGNTGAFHGISVTPTNDFTIPNSTTLTIPNNATLNISNDITMTIGSGATLTNLGTVINNATITNNGTVNNNGTINCSTGDIINNGTFTGNKAIFDMSRITFANASREYTGEVQSLEISGELPKSVSVEYESTTDRKSVGEHVIKAIFSTTSTIHNTPAEMQATLTITQGSHTRDLQIDHGLQVHPNPIIDGNLLLVIPNEARDLPAVVEIFDMNSRRVLSQQLPLTMGAERNRSTQSSLTINISHLPNGAYIVRFGNVSTKIVKQ